MTKLNFLHVCENAFLTEGNKNLNLIGIFDTIFSKGFPTTHPRFSVVVNLSAETSSHKTILVIKKSDQKLFELNTTFEGNRHQIIQSFVNFPFPEEGVYLIEINLDGSFLGSTTVNLKKI